MSAFLRSLVPAPLRALAWDLRQVEPGARATLLRLGARRLLGLRDDPLPSAPRAVLFVCHGNILRSALGEALLRARLEAAGRATPRVASAGLHATDGRLADARGRAAAPSLGVDLEGHRARRLDDAAVAAADVIFVMDRRNEAELVARHPQAERKVVLLGAFGRERGTGSRIIPDPYTGTAEDVDRCYARVARAVDDVAARLGGA